MVESGPLSDVVESYDSSVRSALICGLKRCFLKKRTLLFSKVGTWESVKAYQLHLVGYLMELVFCGKVILSN